MSRQSTSVMAVVAIVSGLLLIMNTALAQSSEPPLVPQSALGTAFTYQGQLKKNGAPITDNCSMIFRLYDQASSGSLIGNPITTTVPITNGLFTVQLDFGANAFAGEARWLDIQVQCPTDVAYLDLGRQSLTAAPYAMYSTSTGALQGRSVASTAPGSGQVLKWNGSTWSPADDAIGAPGSGDISAVFAGTGLSGGGTSGDVTLSAAFAGSGSANTVARSDHNHWGASWSGSDTGLTLSGGSVGLSAVGGTYGVFGQTGSATGYGVWGNNDGTGFGVRGESSGGTGVYGYSTGANGHGVVGEANSGLNAYGVWGRSDTGYGVVGFSSLAGSWNPNTPMDGGIGVYGVNNLDKGYGVKGQADNGYGVYGLANSAVGSGGYFTNTGGGVALWASANGGTNSSPALRVHNNNTTNGIAAYLTNNSGYPTLEMDQHGSGRLIDLQTWGSGDFIAGYDGSVNLKFRIDSNGTGHSAGGWSTSAQDYAEMLPSVNGLEPGDVLIIGDDGQLTRSTQACQTSVVGVYSTQPGFIGGAPVEGPITGTIPLAIVGIVPVKVSAENGAIHPGDLLVASSIPGHAMKAGANPPVGTVIGKALEAFDASHKTGVIKLLVTLR
jgi:hypothetical protein